MNGEVARQSIYSFDMDMLLSAKASCTRRGKQLQKMAADSQSHNLFRPLEALGYEVHLWIVTSNLCDPDFGAKMKAWYAPWLKAYITAPEKNSRGELIHLTLKHMRRRNTKASNQTETVAQAISYERVIFTRPDVVHLNPAHAKVFVQRGALVFPFKCRDETTPRVFSPWGQYMCASDIVFSMPYSFLERGYNACMGKYGCFDSRWRNTSQAAIQPNGYPNESDLEKLRYCPSESGHGCLMCWTRMFGESEMPAVRFVDDEAHAGNAREDWNEVYSI